MALHKLAPLGDVHPIHNWSVTDQAARLALVVTAADVGKVAAQISDASFWVLQNNTGPVWKNITNPATGIPAGGTTGQSLQKIDGTDYNVQWAGKYPTGGILGQFLGKNSAADQDASWLTPPAGGAAATGEAAWTAPPTTGWSWFNQGTATVTSSADRQVIQGGASASGANIRGRVRSLANLTPYTLIARFKNALTAKSFQSAGLVLSNGTGFIVLDILGITTPPSIIRVASFTNATTFSTQLAAFNLTELNNWWLKIQDDGTNKIYSFGTDGTNWVQIFSHGRAAIFAPTQAGFMIGTENAATPNIAPICNLLSWTETNP